MMKEINPTALAFLGDAVYETQVRKHLIQGGQTRADKLHKAAVTFVCAHGQATALKAITEQLTPEEYDLVRRTRNRKITSKPQNADPVTYKLSTAFEALLGHLYLSRDETRLQQLIACAIQAIESGANQKGAAKGTPAKEQTAEPSK